MSAKDVPAAWGSGGAPSSWKLRVRSFSARFGHGTHRFVGEIDEESMKSHEKSCYQHILLVERSLSLRRAARALLRCELLKAMHSPCLVCI